MIHRKVNRINLESDDEIKKTIGCAVAGNQNSAWFLIHQIETALKERRLSEPLFDYLAEYFGALLNIHNEKDGKADSRALAKAFGKLNVIRARGQPERDDDERIKLAARMVLLKLAGLSADAGLNALAALEIYTRKAYRTAYDEWGEQLEKFSVVAELEVLAEKPQLDLLNELANAGAISKQEKKIAIETAEGARARLQKNRKATDDFVADRLAKN